MTYDISRPIPVYNSINLLAETLALFPCLSVVPT